MKVCVLYLILKLSLFSTPTPTAATPSSFPIICEATPHKATSKANSPSSLPTIDEAGEEKPHNQRSRFPPIPTSQSLTAPQNPISVGISRGSPKPIKPKQLICAVSRSQKTLEKSGGSGRGPSVTKLPSIPHNHSAVSPTPPLPKSDICPVFEKQKIAELKTTSGSPLLDEPKTDSGTPVRKEQSIAESETTQFPPVSQTSHTVGSCEEKDKDERAAHHPPHKDNQTADHLRAPPTMRVPAQSYVTRQTADHLRAPPTMRVPAQSYVTRRSTFKDTPLGYKPTHSRRQKNRSNETKVMTCHILISRTSNFQIVIRNWPGNERCGFPVSFIHLITSIMS